MFKEIIRLLRPPHWIKNGFVFVPLVFSKNLGNVNLIKISLLAFVAFSLVSSLVYIFNDIFDKDADRNHPIKKNRPIAKGTVTVRQASLIIASLIVLIVLILYQLPTSFGYVVILYLAINIAYSAKLKEIVLLDIFIIAMGFMLRVIAGGYAISVELSDWLILTTLFLSLFLGVMKRRSELNYDVADIQTRKVLQFYSKKFVDQIAAISAGGVIICYSLYTVAERTESYFRSNMIVYTTVFVIYGIFRYMYLVYENNKGEDPTQVLLKDIPMLINMLLYSLSIIFIAYYH